MILKSFTYRLYPTGDQAKKIDHSISVCRFIYNLALETKIYAYSSHGKVLGAFDLCMQLVELKKAHPWIAEVDSQSLQAAIKKVETSYKNFFNGAAYPKFKKNRKNGSFQCPNNKREINWENNTLTIPKIKNIPIRISRQFNGKIKTITIIKTKSAKYFASILVETGENIKNPPNLHRLIGIDLGISSFATLSNGEKIDNPRYLKTELARLKVLQRRTSRKKNGSNNYKKSVLKVTLLHEKIANQRNDFLHKLSTKLIRDNQTDTICVETLSISNMIKNRCLSLAISDACWYEFIRQLEYKGIWYGKNIIKIGRFFASSKTCSNCNHKLDELPLSQREWTCPNCGEHHDRDVNAAINIRNSGMGNPGGPAELPIVVGAKKQEI